MPRLALCVCVLLGLEPSGRRPGLGTHADASRFSENMGGGAGAAVKTPKAAMVSSVLTAYACWAGTENQPPRFVRTLDTPPTANGSLQSRPDAAGMPPLVRLAHALTARLRHTGTSPRRRRRSRRRL